MELGKIHIELNRHNHSTQNTSLATQKQTNVGATSSTATNKNAKLEEIENRVLDFETRIQKGTFGISDLVECENPNSPTIIETMCYIDKLRDISISVLLKDSLALGSIATTTTNPYTLFETKQLKKRISRCNENLKTMAERAISSPVRTNATRLSNYYKALVANGESFDVHAFILDPTKVARSIFLTRRWLEENNEICLVFQMSQRTSLGIKKPETFIPLTFSANLNDHLSDGKELREHITIAKVGSETCLTVDNPNLLEFELSLDDLSEAILSTDQFVLLSEYFNFQANKNPNAQYSLGYLNSVADASRELKQGITRIDEYFGIQHGSPSNNDEMN